MKKDKNFIFFLLAGILIFFLLKKKKNNYPPDYPFPDTPPPLSSSNCNILPKLQLGSKETNRLSALYYNNTHGLIKTASIWVVFDEFNDVNNVTNYKSFRNIDGGITANLYNLLYYIYVLNIKRVKEIVERWVGTKKGSAIYSYYLGVLGVGENCQLNSIEMIKNFFINQAIAENSKNNTIYINDNFNKFYDRVKKSNLIQNLP